MKKLNHIIASLMLFVFFFYSVNNVRAQVNINPIKDTTVKSEYPNRNYGNSAKLIATTWESKVNVIYITFDLSQINDSITGASLVLYPALDRRVNKSIHLVNDSTWPELTINWLNRPQVGPQIGQINENVKNKQPLVIPLDKSQLNPYLEKQVTLAISNLDDDDSSLSISSKEATTLQPSLRLSFDELAEPSQDPPTDLNAVKSTDINLDGKTDYQDYNMVIQNFNTNTISTDLNLDGVVDVFDINLVFTSINQSPSSPEPTSTPQTTPTPRPASTPTPPITPMPTGSPSPSSQPTPTSASGPGSLNLSYHQGGIWLTPQEIAQIPMDNSSWDSLESYARLPMDVITELTWTAGGAGDSDTKVSRAMFARAIVGLRTNNQTMLNELRAQLDFVDEAINKAVDEDKNDDEKWAQRNIPLIAVSANLIDYRPTDLKNALRKAIYEAKFDGGRTTIRESALRGLPNKPAWGRWALLSTAYLLEDWPNVNASVKAHAKALGEPNWNGAKNNHIFTLSGDGDDDDWQSLQPGGKSDPIAIMPPGTYYQDHGVGGLYLADQYRAANGPEWTPAYTDYIYEGMSSYHAVSWAADHLGYHDVFSWGDFALLRALLFAYSAHDGKNIWPAAGNDVWHVASIMTWATARFGNTLPERLKPEPSANITWPLPVSPGGSPGRGMGFMYATHYARLVR